MDLPKSTGPVIVTNSSENQLTTGSGTGLLEAPVLWSQAAAVGHRGSEGAAEGSPQDGRRDEPEDGGLSHSQQTHALSNLETLLEGPPLKGSTDSQ